MLEDLCVVTVALPFSVVAVGMSSLDVPVSHFSRDMNRKLLVLAPPPEPSNAGGILEELVRDLEDAGAHGVAVSYKGQRTKHFPFVATWTGDALARVKFFQRGGPGRWISAFWSRQPASYLVRSTHYPAGYIEPVTYAANESDTLEVYAGDQRMQLTHNDMLEQARIVKVYKADVQKGVVGAAARLKEFQKLTGCSGTCVLEKLGYIDLRNVVRLPLCHQFLLGNWKSDYYRAFQTLLGPAAAPALKRMDERANVRSSSQLPTRPHLRYWSSLCDWLCAGASCRPAAHAN